MDATAPPSPVTAFPDDDDEEPVLVSSARQASGSIGPFFAVMSAVVVLSVLACVFGRYCVSWAQGPDASRGCSGWWARRRAGGGGGGCMGRGREPMPTAAPADLQPEVKKSTQPPVP